MEYQYFRHSRQSTVIAAVLCAFTTLVVLNSGARGAAVAGLWDGTIDFDEAAIPFTMELHIGGASASGSFFNGDDRISSTSGSMQGNQLTLNFDHYATARTAAINGDFINGQYGNGPYGVHSVTLRPHQDLPAVHVHARFAA